MENTNIINAQQWLTNNYENKKEIETEINSKGKQFGKGGLKISGYPNLEKIFLVNAQGITELEIENCPKVEVIFVTGNQITKITGLTELENLRKLHFVDNQMKEIDISQNKNLEALYFARNPQELKFVNGLKNLSKLVFWNSDKTFAITKLLDQASGEDLKQIANKLGLNVDEKTPEEMKNLIIDEIDKINQNKAKLNEEFPDLISDQNEINEEKLEEIIDDISKGEKYQELLDNQVNDPIVDTEEGEVSQDKLTDKLKKAAAYEELVRKNDDLTTDDKSGIDQGKIDGIRTASGKAATAMAILGVNDLNEETLKTKLGESKLSDIPVSETLESVLAKNKKLEEALSNAGIDPSDANLKNDMAMLKGLEQRIRQTYGDEYKEILEVQEYQSQIEVNTN